MIQEVGATQTTTQTRTTDKSTVGKDEFLKLLTYQLKSQNPLNPADNQEFAAQLAQFSQLEQLTDIRSLLEDQANLNMIIAESLTNTAIPGMIGKTASVSTNKFQYDGEDNSEIGFNSPYQMQSGNVSIYDENGNLIRTIKLSGDNLAKGNHTIIWDGVDNNGSKVARGTYTFDVTMSDGSGASFSGDKYISGIITAVRFKTDGTYVVINNQEVSLSKIIEIS
ncbi:MAG TPA: flagellar hook capping FlgD N-terminal domain-containing protein [Candidatus Kapabacteria bacterium]|nr:flagellar hook capping FlgD N-terminal domain-containing protein [Candidatus Kapabacteria bacterium]